MLWLLLAGCGRDCEDVDADGDGAPKACPGEVATADGFVDCDDNDPAARPGATELCDGVDNDCDGEVDDGLALTWFLDLDGDGYGGEALDTCDPPESYVRVGGDCDDASAAIGPHAEEVCDGVDNDCDGGVDDGAGEQLWYADADGDGTPGEDNPVESCEPPDGYFEAPETFDCDDSDAEIGPHAEELCDTLDNDCDGEVDEGVPSLWYVDADLDGLGSGEEFTGEDCDPPAGYALNADDCDDDDASVGATFPDPYDGDIAITDADDMAGLCPCYTAVSGALRIRNLADSTDLTGLSCLQSAESLVVSGSDSLTTLDGLEALSVETSITLQDNDLLEDLSGLSGVTALTEALNIESNPVLADLSGLESLTNVGGGLNLTDNASLTTIDLPALERLGKLSVSSCDAITDISGMDALVEILRDVSVEGCGSLTTIDLPALESTGGDLYLYNNASLATLSLPALSDVGGELRLHWVAGVTDLDGLSGVTEVGTHLVLWGNAALSDVTGLHGVTSIGGDLTISNNPDLATEDAEALEEAIGADNIRGSTTISNNGG